MLSLGSLALKKINHTTYAKLYIALLILSALYSANFLLEYVHLYLRSEGTEQYFSATRLKESLSDATQKELISLKENLFSRHCALIYEKKLLQNQISENCFISSLKWKNEVLTFSGGADHISGLSEFKKIWSKKIISFEAVQKKNNFYQLVCSFDLEPAPVVLPSVMNRTLADHKEWLDLCGLYHLELISWKTIKVPQSLRSLCDKIVHIKFSGSWDRQDSFLTTLENQGWILGRKGHICAKEDALVFDLELLHLC